MTADPTIELCPYCWNRLGPGSHEQHQGWEWFHCGQCLGDFIEPQLVSRVFAQAIERLVATAAARYPAAPNAARAALRHLKIRRRLMRQLPKVEAAAQQIAAEVAQHARTTSKPRRPAMPARIRSISTRHVPLCPGCWRWLTGPDRYNQCGGWKWFHCSGCGSDFFDAKWVPAHRARDLDDKVVAIRNRRDPHFDHTQLGSRPATRIRRALVRTGWLDTAA